MLALDGLRFPPTDLQQSLAQQTLVLEAARDAAHGLTQPRERTSVLVGMGCDAEVARYGARWRLATISSDPAWLASARDGIVPLLKSSGTVGTMPNIPANRINSRLGRRSVRNYRPAPRRPRLACRRNRRGAGRCRRSIARTRAPSRAGGPR